MALHVRFATASGGSFGCSIERLFDGLHYDFSTSTFVATPTTEVQAMTVGSGNYAGLYTLDFVATPIAQFSDGEYAAYIHNTSSANLVVAVFSVVMINGDSIPLTLTNIAGAVLNSAAGSYNQTNTIGAKINAAGTVGSVTYPPNFSSLSIDATTGGVIVKTNNDKTGYALANGVLPVFPANFSSLVIDQSSGGVIVKTNNDKTGYALANGVLPVFPANFSSLVIDQSSGGVIVKTNNDKNGYALSQALPANFGSLAIDATTGGVIVKTNNDKNGYALSQALPANFGSLAIDATTGGVIVKTNNDKNGYALSQALPANFGSLAIDATTGGVIVKTNNDKNGYALMSSGLDAIVVETGLNARQSLSIIAAATAGTVSGVSSGTVTINGANSTVSRILAQTDSLGDRTTVVLTVPA